jgi:hypothetical protein
MADNTNLPIQTVTVVSPDITTIEKNTNIQTAVLTPYNSTPIRDILLEENKILMAEAEARAKAKARIEALENNKPMMRAVEAYGQEKVQLTKEDKNQINKLKKLYGF